MSAQDGTSSFGNWSLFYDTVRDIMRDYEAVMDVYEFKVLFFIFKRTYMYSNQKEWERIPLSHFVDGVYDRSDGSQIAAPTGMDRKKLLQALKHLEGKRLIEVRRRFNRESGRKEASEYRIRRDTEINDDQILEYLRANQPRIYQSIIEKTVRHTPGRMVIGNLRGRSENGPTVGVKTDLGVGPKTDQLNLPKEKLPILNIAPVAQSILKTSSLGRKLNIKKDQS